MTSSDVWDARTAEGYDAENAAMSAPEVLGPTLDRLVELAEGGPVLELAIGTGRVAVPLAARGLAVSGIELSEPMVAELRTKVDADQVPVVVGDMARVRVPGAFSLVYLVYNTISNLLTQPEQVACFRNAATHLEPGGLFVIENYLPAPPPRGETVRVFTRTPEHLGFEEYHVAAQLAVSHHYWVIDGELRVFSSPHRYVWPGELDLMARLAGLTLRERWSDWRRTPFTSESTEHISVWQN